MNVESNYIPDKNEAILIPTQEYSRAFTQAVGRYSVEGSGLKGLHVQTMDASPAATGIFESMVYLSIQSNVPVSLGIDYSTLSTMEYGMNEATDADLKGYDEATQKALLDSREKFHSDLRLLDSAGVDRRVFKGNPEAAFSYLNGMLRLPRFLADPLSKLIGENMHPAVARNHNKWAIFDPHFVDVTGANLNYHCLFDPRVLDVVLRWANPEVVAAYKNAQSTLWNEGFAYDEEIVAGNESQLLINSGTSPRPITVQALVDVIESQDNSPIYYVNQLIPTGHVLKALLKVAKDGKEVFIRTSNPDHIFHKMFPLRALHDNSKSRIEKLSRKGARISIDQRDYVHSKILVNGRNLVIGSDNCHTASILVGTQDSMLRTSNPQVVAMLQNWAQSSFSN